MRLAVFNDYELVDIALYESYLDSNGNHNGRGLVKLKHLDDIFGFFDFVKDSKNHVSSFPKLSGSCGINVFIALKKRTDKSFSYPLDMPMYASKTKEALRFFLKINEIQNVAILGASRSYRTKVFLESCGANILCFIDEYFGEMYGIEVLTKESFLNKYKDVCQYIFKSPWQELHIDLKGVIDIKSTWFD